MSGRQGGKEIHPRRILPKASTEIQLCGAPEATWRGQAPRYRLSGSAKRQALLAGAWRPHFRLRNCRITSPESTTCWVPSFSVDFPRLHPRGFSSSTSQLSRQHHQTCSSLTAYFFYKSCARRQAAKGPRTPTPLERLRQSTVSHQMSAPNFAHAPYRPLGQIDTIN
ncbi:hypothetical protein CLIM01_02132 [Colletotrichum limetticola]|uniref:Uncharacterized protein n=1 Tax=Colletotrichum limetticola TaxID=1209924 RepID=A0ABQ9Q9I5_9PEZI|nr:hypothetical protein CLIM01_02132 [Colletotrichum limetticola]